MTVATTITLLVQQLQLANERIEALEARVLAL